VTQQAFLNALSPDQRQQVTTALEAEDARARLTAVVGRYIDEDGSWPTDPNTATMLARQFTRTHEDFTSARYSGAGLGAATMAGIAGAGIALGAGTGAKVLGSKLMASYYKDMLAYSTGLNPVVIKAMKRGLDQVTRGTRWEHVARDLTAPSGPSDFSIVFGDGLEQVLEREMVGTLRRLAWRGARSGLNHARGATIGDFADENPWIENYARAFARNQSQMSQRTIRRIIENNTEVGNRALTERLKMLWDLTPQHAQAVENYREGLRRQDRGARSIRRLTSGYADRLRTSRLRTLSATESMTAFNLGRETQWMRAVQAGQMPIDTQKMWITGEDELVCNICAPMDGQTAELGRPFQAEVTLMVPSAHPNCRCIIVPVSQGQMVVYEQVDKRLIDVEAYTREDGTSVQAHTRRVRSPVAAREAAIYLNGLDEGVTLDPDDLASRFGDFGKDLADGMMAWAGSFKEVSRLRGMLEGKVQPAELRKRRHQDSSLLALADVAKHAPANAPKLYRGMTIKAPVEDIERLFEPGKTLDTTVASFSSSREIADSYAGTQAWSAVRFGRKSVSLVLEPGARGVSIEPVSRNLPSIMGSLDEWVVSGNHEVVETKRTGKHSVEVRLRPTEQQVSKALSEQVIVALLECPFYALAQNIAKSRIWIDAYTRDDGTTVEAHHRSAPGHYGPGESAVPDAIGGNKLVGAAASLLTLGRVVDTEGLVTEMRKLNQRFSRPLRRIQHGEVGKYRSRYLDMMAEGQGFRLGNENRINSLAQKMMSEGYDQTQPIRMVVYTDGAAIVDGAHRAQAAKRAGIRKVPVQVAHTGEAMPRPETFREEWDEMRTALLRMDARKSDDTGYETPRNPRIYETWFNDIMERRGREQAADTFAELGVS